MSEPVPTTAKAPQAAAFAEDFITIKRASRSYHSPAGAVEVLRELDLSVRAGEFVAVIGKSGSGKSALARLLAALERPASGEVWVDKTALHSLSASEAATWRGRHIGILAPGLPLLPRLTLAENVLLPMELHSRHWPRERLKRALALLDQVGLGEQGGRLPVEVTLAAQRRVALARALANDPPLLVADEPTAGLETATADAIFALLRAQALAGRTVVMLTHDEDFARQVDRICLLADGQIVNEHLVRVLMTLSGEQLIEIARRTQPITYMPGQPIIRQGEIGEHLYVVLDGVADVFLEHPGGRRIRVEQLGRGQIFGEMALVGNTPRTATVQAAGERPMSVMAVGRAAFERLIAEAPLLRHDLGRVVDQRRAQLYLQALSRLSGADLLKLAQPIRIDTYQPSQVVVRQGASGDTFFVIVEGELEVVLERPSGIEVVVAQLGEGQYFGEMAIVNQAPRSATVRVSATGAAKVIELTRATFFALSRRSPEFKSHLDEAVGGRQRELSMLGLRR